MQHKHYDSDLNDQEWGVICPLIPVHQGRGRKMTLELQEVLNAIFYVVRTSCQWRALPGDFPIPEVGQGWHLACHQCGCVQT